MIEFISKFTTKEEISSEIYNFAPRWLKIKREDVSPDLVINNPDRFKMGVFDPKRYEEDRKYPHFFDFYCKVEDMLMIPNGGITEFENEIRTLGDVVEYFYKYLQKNGSCTPQEWEELGNQ